MSGFVEFATVYGGRVHVAAGGVYRVTRSVQDGNDTATVTRVEFGNDFQLTQMAAADVAVLLARAGAKLVEFAAPDGAPLFLAYGAITAFWHADVHLDPPGANAVLIVSGHRQSVRQTQVQVQEILAASNT